MKLNNNLKVGLFVSVTSLLIIVAILFGAYKKGFFEREQSYTLASKTGEGIKEGMPVIFSGFNIGKVASSDLDDNGVVLVKITVLRRHTQWIHADSKFTLEKPLFSAPRIVITTANFQSPPLSTKETPVLTEVSDINELIKRGQPILDQVKRIVEHAETIAQNLADPQGDLNRILNNTQRLTSRNSLLEMAVSDPKSVQSVNESLVKLKDIMTKLDSLAGKTDEQLYGNEGALPLVRNILKDILLKLRKLNVTVDNINKISTNASDSTKDLKYLRGELDNTVNTVGELVNKLDKILSSFKKEPEFDLP
jgi:phospholipid/cholesterol/gamma-HCH transport system substrate-binding protein